MQIVIEIDEYDKEWIHNAYDIPNEIKSKIVDAIENGTPIPMGHGDLVDVEKVKKAMFELCDNEERNIYRNPWRDNPHIDAITDALENMPAIIEADKEVSTDDDR